MRKELRTDLTLNGAKFDAGMKAARARLARFNREIGRPLAQGIGRLARLGLVAGVAAGAFAALGVSASASMEQVKLRLEGMSSGAEDFASSWKEVNDLFLRSPLELEPLIAAKTLLKGFGVESEGALKAVSNAAVMMGRSVEDMAMVIGSMETKPLRRLGIEASKLGEQFTFQFRDRAGKAMSVVTQGMDAARKAALQIMQIKFGGSLEKMAKTWAGAMSTFGGVRKQALADLFEPLKQRALPVLVKINDTLIAMIESGRLKELGAQALATASKWGRAFLNMLDSVATFATNLFGSFKTAAIVIGGFVVLVKTGLALPLIKLLAGLGKAIVPLLASPWGAAFGMIAAAFGGWQLGKLLEDKFNISSYVAAGLLRLKAFGSAIAAFFSSIGPGFVDEFESKLDEVSKRLEGELAILKQAREDRANAKPPEVESLFAKWKADFDKITLDAKLDDGSLAAFNEAAGQGLAGLGDGIKNGIRNGLSGSSFSRLFSGRFGKQTEHQRSKEAMKMVKQQEASNKRLSRLVSLQEQRPALAF